MAQRDLQGKTVTTGSRNLNNIPNMGREDISCCPTFGKKFEAPEPTMGKRDTPLDAGGSATPNMKK